MSTPICFLWITNNFSMKHGYVNVAVAGKLVWRRTYRDILQSSSHVTDTELPRWSTKERRAYMETMNDQSARTAEWLINARTLSQAGGKITKSIAIISFFACYFQSLPLLTLRTSSRLQYYPIPQSTRNYLPPFSTPTAPCKEMSCPYGFRSEQLRGYLAGSYAQKTHQIRLHPSSFSFFPDLRAVNWFWFAASAGQTSKYSKTESRLCPLPGYPRRGESF